MVEAGTIVGRKRVDIFQADPPNPAELGIFAKLFSDITHGAGRRILRGQAWLRACCDAPEWRDTQSEATTAKELIICAVALIASQLIDDKRIEGDDQVQLQGRKASRSVALSVNFRRARW